MISKPQKKFCGALEVTSLLVQEPISLNIVLTGCSRDGKTTFAIYCSGRTLIGQSRQTGDVILRTADPSDAMSKRIGHTPQSETNSPNLFKIDSPSLSCPLTITDSPGAQDNKDFYRLVSNKALIHTILKRSEKVISVIVVSDSGLKGGAQHFVISIKSFFEQFRDLESIKNDVFQSAYLVITQTQRSKEQLRAQLKRLRDDFQPIQISDYRQLYKDFITHILDTDKLMKFEVAKDGQRIVDERYSRINEFIRKTKPLSISQQILRLQIQREALRFKSDPKGLDTYQQFMKWGEDRNKVALNQILNEGLRPMIMSAFLKCEVDGQLLKKMVDKYDIYSNQELQNARRVRQMESVLQLPPQTYGKGKGLNTKVLNKFQVIQTLQEIFSIFENKVGLWMQADDLRQNYIQKDFLRRILKCFLKLVKKDYYDSYIRFCYTLSRVVSEIFLFLNLKLQIKDSKIKSDLSNIEFGFLMNVFLQKTSEFVEEEIEKYPALKNIQRITSQKIPAYFSLTMRIPENATEKQYTAYLGLFNEALKYYPQVKQVVVKKTQVLLYLAELSSKSENFPQASSNCSSCIALLDNIFPQSRYQVIPPEVRELNIKARRLMGSIYEGEALQYSKQSMIRVAPKQSSQSNSFQELMKNLEDAIVFYDSINDSASLERVYNTLISQNKNNHQKLTYYLGRKAEFYKKLGRIDKLLETLDSIYQLASDETKRQKVNSQMAEILENREQIMKKSSEWYQTRPSYTSVKDLLNLRTQVIPNLDSSDSIEST